MMDPVSANNLKNKRKRNKRDGWYLGTVIGGGDSDLGTIHYLGKSTLFLLLCRVDKPNYFFNFKKVL